jgi:arsenite oxidase small subunit
MDEGDARLDKQEGTGNNDQPAEGRRNFLKVAVTLSALLAVGGIGAVSKSITQQAGITGTTAASGGFPKIKIANLSDLQINNPVSFNYPLDDEPNILVKLGKAAKGGVGPDGDIVAFSQICQHLGCLYAFQAPGTSPPCNSSYKAPGAQGYCCCHGSVYDFSNGGAVISGPSPRPEPQVILEVDSAGNIYATGMNPPTIFGHNTGSNDVSADLQGGNLVG